jgi:hypothetical protein
MPKRLDESAICVVQVETRQELGVLFAETPAKG